MRALRFAAPCGAAGVDLPLPERIMSGHVEEKGGVITLVSNAYDFSQTEQIRRAEVESITPSGISPMPAGLINTLNEDELRDLLAYLLKK